MTGRLFRQVLQRSVQRAPHAAALEVGGQVLSYADLWGRAGRLAAGLAFDLGTLPPRVGLLTRRSLETYVGYWALVRLGCSVVPLAAGMPTERVLRALEAANVDVLLHAPADEPLARRLAALRPGLTCLGVDGRPGRADPPDLRAPGGSEAYTIFTSGSTGHPKGVPITDENLRAWLPYVVRRYRSPGRLRVAQTADVAWDLSVFTMWLAWAGAGTLVEPGNDPLVTPGSFVADHGITHWFSTPQSITVADLLDDLRPAAMPALRWSLFGGEPLRQDQAARWMAAAPASRLVNIYGPTELTCTCFDYRAPRDPARWVLDSRDSLPIGGPHPGIEFTVLRSDDDTVGELLVRGPQRFAGYVDAEDNEGRFLREGHDDAGAPATALRETDWYRTGDLVELVGDARGTPRLHVVGRADDQVKIDGHRVEPQEVEHVARQHAGVDDIAVVDRSPGPGRSELCAYVVGAADPGPLLHHLRARLPDYMVPAQVWAVSELPRNTNGKVDRRALRERAAEARPRR